MTKRHLIIATRESPLALRQAEAIQSLLKKYYPQLTIELLGITTEADQHLETALRTIGGKGWFVKELEEALLTGRADIAVHSMKDVPMDLPAELCLGAMTNREEARDVFVSNQYASITQLPRGVAIGTSSLRRQTQIRAIRGDLELQSLRGNIHTRLKRLDQGDFAAIILAGAGLKRMQLLARIRAYLSIEECLPAAGQGALGIECRKDDTKVLDIIASLNHPATVACIQAERALCKRLGGGCQTPVAAYAEIHHNELKLRGRIVNKAGSQVLNVNVAGPFDHAEILGIRAAEELLQKDAKKILEEFIGES